MDGSKRGVRRVFGHADLSMRPRGLRHLQLYLQLFFQGHDSQRATVPTHQTAQRNSNISHLHAGAHILALCYAPTSKTHRWQYNSKKNMYMEEHRFLVSRPRGEAAASCKTAQVKCVVNYGRTWGFHTPWLLQDEPRSVGHRVQLIRRKSKPKASEKYQGTTPVSSVPKR